MPESPENYRGIDRREALRQQAVRVVAATVPVIALWNVLFVAPPILRSLDAVGFAEPLYRFFSFICHQIPERSLDIFDHQMAVCSRCFGIYFGMLAGAAIYPLWRSIGDTEPISKLWLFLALVPIGIDWSLTFFGVWENTHLSRFVTGAILGGVCATFIVPAMIEIVRNFGTSSRKVAKTQR